jgi:integrase
MATIRKKRNKWQVLVRRKGIRPVSRTFLSRKDAEAWARHMEVQIDRADLPADPRLLERHTFGELVVRYLETVSPRKRGYENEKIVLGAFLRHPICRKRMSDIGVEDFARYRDERLRTINPKTLKRQLSPVQNLFEVARREWALPIKENPVQHLSLQATECRRERRLLADELHQLIEAARHTRNRLILPIILFSIETGMRRGEILAMRWDHLQESHRALLVPISKNGQSRVIPLSRPALELLSDLPRTSERVFPITSTAFRLAWERLRARAGLRDLNFHDLRHEAISRLFEKGLTAPEAALVSGHRDLRMLFRYTHSQRQVILGKLDRGIAECG